MRRLVKEGHTGESPMRKLLPSHDEDDSVNVLMFRLGRRCDAIYKDEKLETRQGDDLIILFHKRPLYKREEVEYLFSLVFLYTKLYINSPFEACSAISRIAQIQPRGCVRQSSWYNIMIELSVTRKACWRREELC